MFNLIHCVNSTTTVWARNIDFQEAQKIIDDMPSGLDFCDGSIDLVYAETGEPAYGLISYPMQDFTWETIIDVNAYTGEFAAYL